MIQRTTFFLASIFFSASHAAAQAAHPGEPHPRLAFEVASIRLSKPGAQGGIIRALPGGNGYTARNFPVKLMISLMYRVPMRQISGGPAWLESDRYDIEARADKPYTLDELHIMFQNLLADRFDLKFHRETRQGPAYVLTVAPSGSRLKINGSPQDFEIPIQPGKDGALVGRRVSMPYFAWTLGQILREEQRPVIDQTGLSGNYDFTMLFAPPLPPDLPGENLPPEVRDRPSLFDALKDQLGLRLQAQRGPVEFLLIDSVARPSEN